MQEIKNITTLGLLLRKTRKEQGVTQEQLAAMCGVGIRFLREVELGKDTCQIGKVFQVIQTLGINIFAAKRGFVVNEQGSKR